VPKQREFNPMSPFGPPDEDAKAEALLHEEDPFRVVIRGYALIDDRLKNVLNAAFVGGTPDELSGLRLKSRLALAQALGFVAPEVAGAIKALGKIRHRLAHGSDEEVTKSDVRSLFAEFKEILGDGVVEAEWGEIDHSSEIDLLRAGVLTIWEWMGIDASRAVAKRAELDAALAEKRKQAGGLPVERIRELLQQDSVATPTVADETH
jgi:hypothetical protein